MILLMCCENEEKKWKKKEREREEKVTEGEREKRRGRGKRDRGGSRERERERNRLTGTSEMAVPNEIPFLVKKIVLSTRLKPHPTTSSVVNVGPYC